MESLSHVFVIDLQIHIIVLLRLGREQGVMQELHFALFLWRRGMVKWLTIKYQ